MEELISVIVPIYNVQNYLPKCLDSIIEQTFQNLEIILVNDGSPDRCPELCEEYASRDKRIKVVHQANKGLSAARNTGVEIANGDFICFVDSDDYIHPQMYEILYKNAKKNDADISICNFLRVLENQNHNYNTDSYHSNKIKESIFTCDSREALSNLYNSDLQWITLVAWNKLFKKELFNGIRFKVGKIHEDDFIMYHLLDEVNTVVYTTIPLYYYLQRNTSITGEKFNLKRLDKLEALEERIIYFKGKGYSELYDKAYEHYLSLLITFYYLLKRFCPEERDSYEDLRNKFMEVYRHRGNVTFSKNQKVKCALFNINPHLSKMVVAIWNRGSMLHGYISNKN